MSAITPETFNTGEKLIAARLQPRNGKVVVNGLVDVVHPDLCGGCGTRLYVKVGQLHICDHCTQTFGFGSQIWMCTECGTPRKYGDGDPSDRTPKMLNCGKCQDVTEHQFFEVSRGLAGLARK